jgi:transposase
MANTLKTMQVVRTIIQLLQRGTSERSIATELNISRTTVRNYVTRCRSSGYSLADLFALDDPTLSELIYPSPSISNAEPDADLRRSAFDAMRDYFLKELKRTGVTKQLLWEEYRKLHPDGYGKSQFNELLKRYEDTRQVSMRFEYKPAQLIMIDFAGDKLHYTDRDTGEVIGCQVLVCVLPFSGYSFVIALPDATLPQLVKGLNACLAFFGGAPYSLKCDNMRQAVTKSCRYEPVFTDMISAWALHNNIHLLAARVRKPRDKAHVENEVKITYSRIYAPLRDKVFHSVEELNKAIVQQLHRHHKRPFQKKDFGRLELFTQSEQSALQPLPPAPFSMKFETQAKVQRNYHVILGQDRHQYSVPYSYVGKALRIIYDTDIVEMYFQHQRIAMHKRNYKKHGYTTLPEHMPDAHKSYREQMGWDKDYFLRQAEKIGPATRSYIERMLTSRAVTEQSYNGCLGILRLSKSYPSTRVEAACKRALLSQSTSYKTICNILAANLDTQDVPQQLSFNLPSHDNLRGSDAYN